MDKAMKQYTLNKVLSLSSVVAVVLVSLWYFGYVETQWQFVMVVLISMAYSHYLIGGFYQLKSFLRKDTPWQHFLTFAVLVLFSIVLTQVFFAIDKVVAFLLLLFYFLIHGLLNEQTLLYRQTGKHIETIFVWPLFLMVIAVLAYAIPDHTFIVNRDLTFAPPDDFLLTVLLSNAGLAIEYFTIIFWVSVGISLLLLIIGWFKSKKHKFSISMGVVLLGIVAMTYIFGPLPYIYMLFMVVGYHFVTWFLFYFTTFKERSQEQLAGYILIHLALLVPFIVGGFYFFEANTPSWSMHLFDYYFFTFATYIHITTSFMNDQWFQKIQSRVFEYFS
jgi:hypothetical protein